MVDSYDNLDILTSLLQTLLSLRRLKLALPGDYEKIPYMPYQLWKYQLIFPPAGHWPNLTIFGVDHLAIHLSEIIRLLVVQMPSLRQLQCDCINLLEGEWQGVIKLLKYACRLDRFLIEEGGELLHCDQDTFLDEMEGIDRAFVRDVDQYVVAGSKDQVLKHPCLFSYESLQESQQYLHALLQQRERGPSDSISVGIIRRSIKARLQTPAGTNRNEERLVGIETLH